MKLVMKLNLTMFQDNKIFNKSVDPLKVIFGCSVKDKCMEEKGNLKWCM